MTDLLPRPPRLSVSRVAAALTRQRLQKLEHLLILAPENLSPAQWRKLPSGTQLKDLQKRIGSKSAIPAAQTRLNNSKRTGISLGLLPVGVSPFKRLDRIRLLLGHAMKSNPGTLGALITGFDDSDATASAEAVTVAALAAVSEMPSHKSKPSPAPRLRALQLFGDGKPQLRRLRAENEGNHLARWLTTLPPNDLDSASYKKRIAALAKQHGWEMSFLDRKRLARLKAGAFLAVAQGGDSNAGIVHLRYRPPDASKKRPDVALVGKGICFDTGGVNLKPAQHMQNMHDDMQGSAVALGTLTALSRVNSKLNVDCWLAITENLIGPGAYKPMDVVTASNGTTIEIIHTDAEGRMALADTLALAAEKKPAVIIDYATLTGACVGAVTERYSGAFSNRQSLNPYLIKAGDQSGERVWPFPMDDDFDTALNSSIADIKQCTLDGIGDHILAARFLSRFAGSGAWVHIDLSSGRHKGGLAHIPTDVTGFGVRFTMNLLHEQELLKHSLANR
ncbi:MAG: leucyl aminopeptidase family protein [Gammaproteobacteria bacterium]|nr:leucyl aminopeptidase family protein [Gammaproteobacteria bacterium]MDH3767085.1 leucyl aminopeptidase family protein [Gammaproteobacteria bacterium]